MYTCRCGDPDDYLVTTTCSTIFTKVMRRQCDGLLLIETVSQGDCSYFDVLACMLEIQCDVKKGGSL